MLKFIENTLDKYLLPNTHFQNYINHRYNSNTHTLIEKKFLTNTFCTHHNTQFHVNDQLFSINEVLTDYHFSDIRPTDIVLDIGANIGAFTLFASKKAKHVFSVEPLYTDILRKNIAKNNIKNVTVLELGVGDGNEHLIKYGNRSKKITTTSFSNLLQMCNNQIDFLKCDCEGGEWSISPTYLKGIRRIEMEVHHFKNMPPLHQYNKILKAANFNYTINPQTNITNIIHAKAKQ